MASALSTLSLCRTWRRRYLLCRDPCHHIRMTTNLGQKTDHHGTKKRRRYRRCTCDNDGNDDNDDGNDAAYDYRENSVFRENTIFHHHPLPLSPPHKWKHRFRSRLHRCYRVTPMIRTPSSSSLLSATANCQQSPPHHRHWRSESTYENPLPPLRHIRRLMHQSLWLPTPLLEYTHSHRGSRFSHSVTRSGYPM